MKLVTVVAAGYSEGRDSLTGPSQPDHTTSGVSVQPLVALNTSDRAMNPAATTYPSDIVLVTGDVGDGASGSFGVMDGDGDPCEAVCFGNGVETVTGRKSMYVKQGMMSRECDPCMGCDGCGGNRGTQ